MIVKVRIRITIHSILEEYFKGRIQIVYVIYIQIAIVNLWEEYSIRTMNIYDIWKYLIVQIYLLILYWMESEE